MLITREKSPIAEKHNLVPSCLMKIRTGLAWDRTRASTVAGQGAKQ